MELIEGVALSKLCDYSFGDQSGQWGNIYTSFMKDANFLNTEFATKVFEVMQTRDYMTVFIDNIRLYIMLQRRFQMIFITCWRRQSFMQHTKRMILMEHH